MTLSLVENLRSLRVDLVGSLLRPAKLKIAFSKWGSGEMTEEELQKIQDEAIREVIATQEAHHLPLSSMASFAGPISWRVSRLLPALKNGRAA